LKTIPCLKAVSFASLFQSITRYEEVHNKQTNLTTMAKALGKTNGTNVLG